MDYESQEWWTLGCLGALVCSHGAGLDAGRMSDPQPKGLTPHQQQVLRAQGFEPAEQGWELQMPGKLLFEFDSSVLGNRRVPRSRSLPRR